MVDKDGKKVDIMGDLVRLEGELQSYGREIKDLLGRVRRLDQDREKVFDRFSA
jgi:predicted RNA-binding protein